MEVIFFKLDNGTKPVREFIHSIEDKKLKEKTIRSIKLLEIFGHNLTIPDSRHLEDGIFELRAKQGTNIARCLYFFTIGDIAVITNGIVKKGNKTPRAAIELAKKYRKMYKEDRDD